MSPTTLKCLELIKIIRELEKLRPKAVLDLYRHGYSADDIAHLLKMGKINVLEILKINGIRIRRRGQVGRQPIKKKVR